jgi:predicted RNA-binding protein with PIN domain
MSYLIDGSNLGGVLAGRRGSRNAVEVVRWLLPWVRSRKRVTVYFDGPPQPDVGSYYGPLEVIFTGGRSADEMIIRRVSRRERGVIVITNDTALARSCRALGAIIQSPAELSQRQAKAKDRADRARAVEQEKPNPSPEDTALWREMFEGENSSDD